MSVDNGPQDRDGKASSGVSRREVLLTVGGVVAAVVAGAAAWGVLELFVNRGHAVGAGLNVTYLQVVMVLGTLACVVGVILCIRTARTRFDEAGAGEKDVNIGVARLPALVFARLVAELDAASPEFHHWWPQQDILGQIEGVKALRHPRHGIIEFAHIGLQADSSAGAELRLTAYTPLPGASARRLQKVLADDRPLSLAGT